MKDKNQPDLLQGIGGLARRRLAIILRKIKGCISAKSVQETLQISPGKARRLLSSWAKNGWLKRIQQGLYLPIDIEADNMEQVLLDPWKIGIEKFFPCYIGGWSAAQYWELTDQIFESTILITTKHFDKKQWLIGPLRFIVTKVKPHQMFGLTTIWKDGIKITISDIHKTIIDLLNNPSLGGGILSVTDYFLKYLSHEQRDLNVLIQYGDKMENRTIFKRLGFLLEIFNSENSDTIAQCLNRISKGNTQLDPATKGRRLVKKWRLWIPENLTKALKMEML